MSYNFYRAQGTANRLITKYGAPCVLRRSTGDRPCIAVELEYSPVETVKLANPTARLFLVSPVGVTVPPNNELDRLVTFYPGTATESDTLRIFMPVGRLAPAGIIVYWELHCTQLNVGM